MALRCKWYHIWFHVSCLVHGLHGVRFRDGTLAHWITYSVGGLGWWVIQDPRVVALSPGPAQNWGKGLATLAKISIRAVSGVFVWSREIIFIHYQLLHSLHMKVIDSFQAQLKMGTRLADFLQTLRNLEHIYTC